MNLDKELLKKYYVVLFLLLLVGGMSAIYVGNKASITMEVNTGGQAPTQNFALNVFKVEDTGGTFSYLNITDNPVTVRGFTGPDPPNDPNVEENYEQYNVIFMAMDAPIVISPSNPININITIQFASDPGMYYKIRYVLNQQTAEDSWSYKVVLIDKNGAETVVISDALIVDSKFNEDSQAQTGMDSIVNDFRLNVISKFDYSSYLPDDYGYFDMYDGGQQGSASSGGMFAQWERYKDNVTTTYNTVLVDANGDVIEKQNYLKGLGVDYFDEHMFFAIGIAMDAMAPAGWYDMDVLFQYKTSPTDANTYVTDYLVHNVLYQETNSIMTISTNNLNFGTILPGQQNTIAMPQIPTYIYSNSLTTSFGLYATQNFVDTANNYEIGIGNLSYSFTMAIPVTGATSSYSGQTTLNPSTTIFTVSSYIYYTLEYDSVHNRYYFDHENARIELDPFTWTLAIPSGTPQGLSLETTVNFVLTQS